MRDSEVVGSIADEVQELGAHGPIVLSLGGVAKLDVLAIGGENCEQTKNNILTILPIFYFC